MRPLLVVLVACLALGASIDARADVVNGIDILSQSYTIHSEWSYNWYTMPPGSTWFSGGSGTNDQSSTDGSPISFGQVGLNNPPGIGLTVEEIDTSIDSFSFSNYAFAALDHPQLSSDGNEYYLGPPVTKTSDQASWTFEPIGTTLDVGLNIYEYNFLGNYAGMVVSLQDITDSTTLLSIDPAALGPLVVGVTIDEDLAFAVDPAHVYQFSISAWSHVYDGDEATQSVTATLTSVPEPSALWLLWIGLCGVYGGICLKQGRRASARMDRP